MLKRYVFFLLLAISVQGAQAQQPALRELGPYSELIVGDRIIVRLVKADKESATIQVQGIAESALKTEITGTTLKLSIYGEPFTKKKIIVTLQYVKLTAITVTGGADVTTTSLLKSDKLNVDLKSGGMLYLDADLESLTGKLVEGSALTAEGYATDMDIAVATKATLSAYDLECEKINIKASSGGKAKINVEAELNAEASSNGYISYKGTPAKIISNPGSGGTIQVYKP